MEVDDWFHIEHPNQFVQADMHDFVFFLVTFGGARRSIKCLSFKRLTLSSAFLLAVQMWRDLESTAERRMRECAVILNLLIANVFWLICKDERKKRNDQLSEGDSIFPYIKTYRSFLKTSRSFCLRIGLHIRWHKSTRIYASGHTYIRIELHVRMHEPARIYVIVSGSVISCTRVWLICLPSWQTLFHVVYL